ncbi:MAG: helix-turn-helix domain-containing protein [Pirellulales bacterium]|nr:helix-turn-helix domain-containing protein [Pirellulales bacterium]
MSTFVGHIKNGFLDRLGEYSPAAIVVWLALANQADRRGKCYPSLGALREATGLARSTVHKAVSELVEAGEITVESGGGKGNPSNHYQFVGGPGNELVRETNQSGKRTKVVRETDKGSPGNGLKPDARTRHKNQTKRCARFTPPTLDEVTAYCLERKNHVDPQRFIDYYVSNGWLVGRNAMKSWQAAVRNWERNNFDNGNGKPKHSLAGSGRYRADDI